MINSSTISNSKFSRKVFYVILLVTLLGIADATYLTVNHYSGESVVCSITQGCEKVLTSEYANIFGIPLALLGLLYYLALFMLAYYFQLTGKKVLLGLFRTTVILGVLITAALVYLQLFVIEAICQYCMVSAGLTTILLIVVITSWVSERRSAETNTKN